MEIVERKTYTSQVVHETYLYDSEEEYEKHYSKMMAQGWCMTDTEYRGKDVQWTEYTKEITVSKEVENF